MDIPILSDIWNAVSDRIDWVIFLIVLGMGYLPRVIPYKKEQRLTLRVIYFTIIPSVAYAYFEGLSAAIWICSYFITIGFHSILLKLIESWVVKKFPSLRSIGGGGHQKPPNDDD